MELGWVEARGDAFAIGEALGRHARRSIHEMLPTLAEFAGLMTWAGSPRLVAMEKAARAAFPRHVREIEGMAAGAGIDFAKLFAWNCRGDLRFPAGSDLAAAARVEGCTTVFMAAGAESGRPAVIGHNEDGEAEMAGHCFLAEVIPDQEADAGPGFVSFCYPGLLPGHAFAVNRAGLVQTINNIGPDDLRVGLPRHIITRAVLDCADIDSAVTLLSRRDRAGGFHHGLAQAGDPRLLAVEAPPAGCHVRQVESYHAHANHLIEAPFEAAAQRVTPSSASRQERAESLLAADALAGRDPGALLFDRDGELPIHRRGQSPGDDGFTLASAVFEIHPGRVDWSAVVDPSKPPCYHGSIIPQ